MQDCGSVVGLLRHLHMDQDYEGNETRQRALDLGVNGLRLLTGAKLYHREMVRVAAFDIIWAD